MRHELVPGACRAAFEVRSSVHPIRAETREVTGAFELDEVDGRLLLRPGARLQVRLADLRSGNPLVDRETRRRLDLRRHPDLVAVLDDARPRSAGVLACAGRVTFHGSERPVEGELHLTRQGQRMVLAADHEADVRRWGLQPPRLLVLKVAPQVAVRLDLQAQPVAGIT